MQHVSGQSNFPRVLVFETSLERATLITDRLLDHGIDVVFADAEEALVRCLKEHSFHVLLLNDCPSSNRDILELCTELRRQSSAFPEVVVSSDNPRLHLHDCHRAGCAHLINRSLDFTEFCDLVERVAQVSGKRLYDGKQIRLAKRFGEMSGQASKSQLIHDLSMQIEDISRGGFYYEVASAEADHLSEGTMLSFELKLAMFPNYSFHGKGYVSWIRRLPGGRIGIGVEFAMIPKESEHLLRTFSDLFKIKEFIPIPNAA
jgi:CheY-like chemotaxis protein